MIEIEPVLVAAAIVTSFAAVAATSYMLGKYNKLDLNGNGKVETEEIKTVVSEAIDTFTAYKDAIDDIVEDVNISPEDAVAYIKSINKIFKK